VLSNLRLVRGKRNLLHEQRDVLRTFASYAACLAEALAAERPEAKHAKVQVEGKEHLTAALASGRGVIIVTGHVGPWDAASRLLAEQIACDVIVVMLREPDERARALHDAVRVKSGMRIVHVGEHALDALPLLRHLKNGGVVAIQLDRAPAGARAVDVELFGRPFSVPEGPFRLAALTSAPVLPLFARRIGYFDYELCVSPGIDVSRSGGRAEIVRAATAATAQMECFIRKDPTQWFHFDGVGP
jgi:KDO2-lipid IV(A) lauroyltransferase